MCPRSDGVWLLGVDALPDCLAHRFDLTGGPGRGRRCLTQLGAIRVHLSSGDRQIPLNITLILVAAVTVWLATTWL